MASDAVKKFATLRNLILVLAVIQLCWLVWFFYTGKGGAQELVAYLMSVALALQILFMYEENYLYPALPPALNHLIVAIYLGMIPELPVAMLACARIGAAHSVVFGGFSAESLRDRINDAGARVLITADGGYRRGAIVLVDHEMHTTRSCGQYCACDGAGRHRHASIRL